MQVDEPQTSPFEPSPRSERVQMDLPKAQSHVVPFKAKDKKFSDVPKKMSVS